MGRVHVEFIFFLFDSGGCNYANLRVKRSITLLKLF